MKYLTRSCSIVLQNHQGHENKESLNNCHRLKKTKRWLNAVWCPRLDSEVEDINEKNQWNLSEIWNVSILVS